MSKMKAPGDKKSKTPGAVANQDVCLFTLACFVFPGFKTKFLLPFGKYFEPEVC